MFMKGEKCELRALEESDHEATIWTKAVNAGLTTQHLFTGSIPMRPIDVKAVWKKEREAGSVEFGIWVKGFQGDPGAGIPYFSGFIGTCGLYSHRDIYKSWEFRIIIFDPRSVGHGVGKEATHLVTDYAFQRLNAHRVWLGVNAENLRALKCYLDCGYKIEGTLRDEIYCFGHYCDVIRMGVLENEWQSIAH